jgi:hypothetical protein
VMMHVRHACHGVERQPYHFHRACVELINSRRPWPNEGSRKAELQRTEESSLSTVVWWWKKDMLCHMN